MNEKQKRVMMKTAGHAHRVSIFIKDELMCTHHQAVAILTYALAVEVAVTQIPIPDIIVGLEGMTSIFKKMVGSMTEADIHAAAQAIAAEHADKATGS